jgi:hypothetical protein
MVVLPTPPFWLAKAIITGCTAVPPIPLESLTRQLA